MRPAGRASPWSIRTIRTARESRSRLDLAGRLFRPHWRLFRGTRASSSEPGANRGRRRDAGSIESSQHPLDVICGGMYRACSTWQYEVAAHLIEQYLGGQRLGYLTGDQYAALLRSDALEHDQRTGPKHAGGGSSSRTKGTDRSPARSPRNAGWRSMPIVTCAKWSFRLMHKRGMTFEQLLRQGMIHQILANDRFWMAQPDVLVQRYEDLLADPTRGVIELARHLGIRLEESEAARIAALYSHESNKARTEALRRRLQEAGVDLESAANAQICDPTTLLHWNHIRQGDAKSWRTLANPRQRRVLERLCGRWLRARGYSADYSEPGKARVSVRELVRAEVDIVVGRATFLIRTTSLRYPASGPSHQATSRATRPRAGRCDRMGGRDSAPARSQANRRAPHLAHEEI